jgi:mannose-6-phosphate isomerase
MYPFLFKPIFKEMIWGGNDILRFKGFTPNDVKIGESWEISHVEGNVSVVANGDLEGYTLVQLIDTYGARLIGEKVEKQFGNTFPLLIKFIDARDNLSIQVHPDDTMAMVRHHSWGKTEMWYVVKAAPGASLYSGFSQHIDIEEYIRRVEDNSIMEVLNRCEVLEGDVFFLPAGRVHAINAGCFIAEIQQTSNITYRIYDYNRIDAFGNNRQLHTDLAKQAIDYTVYPEYRTEYIRRADIPVELVNCKYFVTNILEINKPISRDYSALDSFVILICTHGHVTIRDVGGKEITVHQGYTVLVPAEMRQISILPRTPAKLLEVYV